MRKKTKRRIIIWLNYRGALRIAMGMLMVALTIILLTQEIPSSRTWTYWTLPLSGKVIAIDAGHGGVDGGAVSRQGLVEKDLNLAIALYLRDYLQEAGALVYLTREGDYDLAEEGTRAYKRRKTEDLIKRVELIKEHNADVVLSIHMNSIPQQRWSGAQTFYYPNHSDNLSLASLIQEEIKRNLENTTRSANTAKTIYLLKSIDKTPTALVEVGFLSNPNEARQLGDAAYQRKVAASIYQGVLRFVSGERLPAAKPGS
ncbi:N-acetylmuramoyl-L-alanine amidase CwlD [Paenibacillus sp. GCM10012307]|uniref:N-acetylmuramoyl-L-alanine amidase CwlD n=1 Tax=Paenibacillus roseus TaxID=2798579 RepID=A0A934MUG9_9BACL|nr:N-acetylmuramoyl-L-alanine amidase CwlD [Paenibacillus roseus]MBJ6361077.1 N-acetylmuramoyl-L-alanine amidase CwlD [Paenibacillus roseus]